jgi:hypothetical protein
MMLLTVNRQAWNAVAGAAGRFSIGGVGFTTLSAADAEPNAASVIVTAERDLDSDSTDAGRSAPALMLTDDGLYTLKSSARRRA